MSIGGNVEEEEHAVARKIKRLRPLNLCADVRVDARLRRKSGCDGRSRRRAIRSTLLNRRGLCWRLVENAKATKTLCG